MTPVLIVMMNHLSRIGPISQRLTKYWTEMNVRGGEVPFDFSESMIIWTILRGNTLFLLHVYGAFLMADSCV